MKYLLLMKKYWVLFTLFWIGILVSGILPHDYFTWFLEVSPAIVGFVVLLLTFKKFTFTYLTYIFILLHAYILFIGGHYTYAEVPLFNWIQEVFHQTRNNYDKVGHFAQGFIPAMISRELFIRLKVIKPGIWLSVLTVSVCMSISVLYEFLEWLVAIATGEAADSFLGTQGYIWDTQSDMLYATIGAICMLILMSNWQDKQIEKLEV